ncbi:unnamed protein product, partial [Adineta ricciae]
IHVSNIDGGVVGHLVKFFIDASKAGVGQLEIVVQDGLLPCNAMPYESCRFEAIFLPNKSGKHTIDIKFNGLSVPGSPFTCYINDLSRVTVSDSLTSAQVGVPLSFDIHHWDLYDDQNQYVPLDILITAPSGRSVPFTRSQLNESITHIDYILNEIVDKSEIGDGDDDDDDDDNDNSQQFTRRLSFTEKTKQRLEIYRRRSLQQFHDDGRSSISFRFFA